MSLIEKLKAGKRNIKIIEWPGTDEKVGITVLAEGELQDAQFATERLFKAAGIDVTASTIDAYGAENNTQILARALVDPAKRREDGTCEPLFPDVDALRAVITSEVKGPLIDAYNAFQDECSPSPLSLSDDEMEAMIDDLKKNPTYGTGLSLRTLIRLVLYSADRPTDARKDSGSTSSQ